MWLSSSKLRCVDSHGTSGEQLMGETSHRRLDGLTPGSIKPSGGPVLSNKNKDYFELTTLIFFLNPSKGSLTSSCNNSSSTN